MKRATTPSKAGARRGRVTAVLATLAAPGLLYMVARTAMIGLSPGTAAALPPTNYAPALRPLVRASADPRVQLPGQAVDIAKRAAITAPLAFEPFVLAGKYAAQNKDNKTAIALMEEARRRRPNSLVTRLHLMSLYGAERRFSPLLAEMNFILRSSSGARDRILPELVKLLREREGRQALASLLAKKPIWREDFFKVAQQQQVRPEDARDLMALVKKGDVRGDLTLERGLFLQSLLGVGRSEEARRLWLEALPAPERARHALLFDGGFRAVKAPPPFTWKFNEESAGRAEMAQSGDGPYLNVEYFGGENVTLAEQQLALAPGAYTLSFAASSDTGIKSGRLFWSLSCGNGREVARIGTDKVGQESRRIGAGFRVPAGCIGQKLRLMAEPGDISATFNVRLADLQVVRQ